MVIERLSPGDLTQLTCDVGPAPMQVAAILILEGGSAHAESTVFDAIADRFGAVPRLRQRLMRTPLGCGRPVWIDDPHFDVRKHVHRAHCPSPGDTRALFEVAAAAAARRLPADRPLWSATVVTGLANGDAALVVVLHHAVADGVAGLAVLAALVDGAAAAPHPRLPRPAPSRRWLLVDATMSRLRAFAALPSASRRLRAATNELRPGGIAPASSLNRPTGARRRLAAVRVDLAAVRAVAHAHGGTVNDVLLTAVSGALRTLLRRRGEDADRLVISVPASARRTPDATGLGNQVGAMPVSVPTVGDSLWRLRTIAAITRSRKGVSRGESMTLLGPAFRALARVGLFGWFINHQRQVNTFVTNLHGPERRLSFLGTAITDIHPVTVVPGNVTVAFAALSYAGTLAVTVVADADLCPDLSDLTRHLQDELDTLASAAVSTI